MGWFVWLGACFWRFPNRRWPIVCALQNNPVYPLYPRIIGNSLIL
jgi:hypothetical protein